MALALAILGLLSALVPVGLWLAKRQKSKSPLERIDDWHDQIEQIEGQLRAARRRGDDAAADALRRRLRDLAKTKP